MGAHMKHKTFSVKTEEGTYDLEAFGQWIGQDLLVAIWGGDQPHIGALAMAQPRPSLKDPEITSSTVSVFCVLGHKEDELAKAVAEILAATLNTQVVVTAGIHWDHIPQDGIQKVIKNTEILLQLILNKIGSKFSTSSRRIKRY
jgi:hypothetical protein